MKGAFKPQTFRTYVKLKKENLISPASEKTGNEIFILEFGLCKDHGAFIHIYILHNIHYYKVHIVFSVLYKKKIVVVKIPNLNTSPNSFLTSTAEKNHFFFNWQNTGSGLFLNSHSAKTTWPIRTFLSMKIFERWRTCIPSWPCICSTRQIPNALIVYCGIDY